MVSVAIAVVLRPAHWSLSSLPRVNAHTALGSIARDLDPGFATVRHGAYDGQFYWGVAVDPLATGHVHAAFDKASYRYGHPLYGWAAWLLSGDSPERVPAALVVVGVASLVAGTLIASRLGRARGSRGWEALFVALNPGLIVAAAADLAEPLAAMLVVAALAALTSGRLKAAWLCLALLPLAKEPLLVVVVAAVVWALISRRWRDAALFATAILPAVAWWIYARVQLGGWFTTGTSALGAPFVGWRPAFDGDTGAALIAILLALLAVAAIRAFRVRGPLELAYLGLALFAACLATNATAAFTTALRNTAFLVVLLPFVLSRRIGPAQPTETRSAG